MKRFTSNDEIEDLCEAMIKDFFKSKHYTNVMCVDIEAFVREYLGVPIVYETFAEPDPGRVGFLSDGKRPLMVRRNGKVEEITFPPRTAVIEKFLLGPKESASLLPMRAPMMSWTVISNFRRVRWRHSTASMIRRQRTLRNC